MGYQIRMKVFSPKAKKCFKITFCAVACVASIFAAYATYNAYFNVKEVVVVEPEKSWMRQVYGWVNVFGDDSQTSVVNVKNPKSNANNLAAGQNDSGWSSWFGSSNNTPTKKK